VAEEACHAFASTTQVGLTQALGSTPNFETTVQSKHDPEDQIARTYSEMRDGSWLQNAQRRSRRRKSPWNLLLPLFAIPLWLGFTSLLVSLAVIIRNSFHPEHSGPPLADTSGLAVALMLFPFLVASIFVAFLVTNFIVYQIPPARRAMDKEDRDFPGTDYASSQRALLKLALVAMSGAIILAFVGAVIG